jgi:serine/threonine-protein kinase
MIPAMLASGTRLGVYEIADSLGAGGMGEVYRATDTKLGRAVAIKILPDAFATDAERVPRFAREAKVLASLNHPHIAALYGMEEADGRHFLIMELVEGETLADRLRGGALPVDESLRLAVQIADALETAHEQGIVHRDLKPANIKVTPDGNVKLLDFGLAKAVEAGPAASNLTHSPTLSVMATQAGLIMGTAAYMSPEQAKGLSVDRRSDVFSFGVVLFEMLTGRQPFRGDTVAEVMASVMIREADLAALPPTIHSRLRDIITRCLDKQPRQRWQSMGDLRVELEALRSASQAPALPVATPMIARAPLWRKVLPFAATILLGAAVTALLMEGVRPVPPRDVVRLSIPAPEMRLTANSLAIAPGGTAVAYSGMVEGVPQLMVRRANEFEARPVDTVSGALTTSVVFSPDGQSLAFTASRQLRRVDLRGGPPMTICAMPGGGGQGISWQGSSLLFASDNAIYRVADSGGTPQPVVQFESGQFPLRPQALDDAGTLLYGLASGSGEDGTLARQVILQTPAGTRTVLADDGSDPFYVAPNRVVYVRDGTLMAIPVDLRTGQAAGSPVAVVEGIARLLTTAPRFHVALSADGALAFVPGSAGGTERRRLAFVQLEGAVEPLPLPPTTYRHPRLSPDGRQLAVETDDGKEAAVWVGPATGTTPLRRLTFEGRNLAPIWTRNGQSLTFQSDRDGDKGLYVQRADGSAPAVRLTKADQNTEHVAESWSPDDRLLTFRVTGDGRSQIWMVARNGAAPKPLVHVPRGSAVASAFSPDGRWLAYGSNELEAGWSVFVQPFPPTGVKYQLTNRQSSTPVWAADGKQLYFAFTNRVFRADVQASSGMSLGAATEFETANSLPSVPAIRHFDLTSDGKRFLVILPEGAVTGQPTSINVVLNWHEELQAKVP